MNFPEFCTQWIPSYFWGLYYGIKAENTNSVNTILINRSQFLYNHRFVYLSGVNFAKITSSLFKLPQYYHHDNDTVYGIYLNGSTGYKIQENSFLSLFTHDPSYLKNCYFGLIINNSGIEPNEIYNNSFNRLGIGILAQRLNRTKVELKL